ncbi:hypothetical protein BFF94_033160 [Burkholderia catarinensis]|nr:hypothetical protein BFF94_033160 [Burkholderia catarinensis]
MAAAGLRLESRAGNPAGDDSRAAAPRDIVVITRDDERLRGHARQQSRHVGRRRSSRVGYRRPRPA